VAALLALLLCASEPVVTRSTRIRQALDVTPLDIAFLDRERLFVLSDETLSLYRIDAARLTLLSRLALPGAPVRARAAAGMLRVVVQDGACWALSNRREGATLFNLEGDRLLAVAGAEAIPATAFGASADSADGVRFVAGTNLFAVGEAALLRFAAEDDGVERDGTLRLGGQPDVAGRRVGDALAVLDDRIVAVSSAAPPSGADEVRLLHRDEAAPIESWTTKGRIRALAAHPSTAATLLAVAIEDDPAPVIEILALRWSGR
jgi:hypothetical protein